MSTQKRYTIGGLFRNIDPDEQKPEDRPLEITREQVPVSTLYKVQKPWYEELTTSQQYLLVAGGIILVARLVSK